MRSTASLVPVEWLVASNHTVTYVDSKVNPWNNPKGGVINYYTVKLDTSGEKPVSRGLAEGKPAPKVGDQWFGVVEETERGLKFKSVQQGGFGGGKSPEQQRSIVRQHSQEMALRLEANRIAAGGGRFTPEDLKKAVDWFEKDAS